MIPQTDLSGQTVTWQEALIRSVNSGDELCRLLDLEPDNLGLSADAARQFPVKVPLEFVRRMEKGNPDDPLLLQVLNQAREQQDSPQGYSLDPLQEQSQSPATGLLHKYPGRVLLFASVNCAINCRYCFRRHYPYDDSNPGRQEWRETFEYISRDSSIKEVILSGGDPLSAPNRRLHWMVEELAKIPHLQRLRVHTRLPVVIPQRVDEGCIEWLTGSRLKPVMVLHINHAREIDQSVEQMCRLLLQQNIALFNQAVLLRGVNDNLIALTDLSERLFACGITPYYLHLLDKVAGAAHFDVDQPRAQLLHRQLRASVPGYLVPRLVRETPYEPSKSVIQ